MRNLSDTEFVWFRTYQTRSGRQKRRLHERADRPLCVAPVSPYPFKAWDVCQPLLDRLWRNWSTPVLYSPPPFPRKLCGETGDKIVHPSPVSPFKALDDRQHLLPLWGEFHQPHYSSPPHPLRWPAHIPSVSLSVRVLGGIVSQNGGNNKFSIR